ENVQYLFSSLAMPVASGLGASERQVNLGADRRRVHIEDPGLHIFHGAEGAVRVARINRSGQAILHAVDYLDRVIKVATLDNRHDRTEDFFLSYAHLRLYFRKHSWLDEEAILQITLLDAAPAAHKLRLVLVASDFDILENLIDCV